MKDSDTIVLCVFVLLGLARPFYLFWLRTPRPGGRRVRPWLQWAQLGTFYAIIVLSLGEYWYFRRPLLWPVIASALILIAATQAIKIWAITELGPYWSAHVEIHNPHPLKKTGPYAWMRNPGYMNGIIEALCIPLISSSWFTLVFAVICVVVVFSCRIRTEESAMLSATEMSNGQSLMDEYKEYCRTVGRFGSPTSIVQVLLGAWRRTRQLAE